MDCLNHIGVARSTEGDVRLHQLRPLPGDLLPMAGAPPSLRVPPFHEHLHRVSELFLIYQSQMLTTFLFGTQPLFRSLHRIQSIHIFIVLVLACSFQITFHGSSVMSAGPGFQCHARSQLLWNSWARSQLGTLPAPTAACCGTQCRSHCPEDMLHILPFHVGIFTRPFSKEGLI